MIFGSSQRLSYHQKQKQQQQKQKRQQKNRRSRSRLTAIVCPDTDTDTRTLSYTYRDTDTLELAMAAALIGELTFYRYCSGTMQIYAPKNRSPDTIYNDNRGERERPVCVRSKLKLKYFRVCPLALNVDRFAGQ